MVVNSEPIHNNCLCHRELLSCILPLLPRPVVMTLWFQSRSLDYAGTRRHLEPTVRLANLASVWVRWAFVGVLGKIIPILKCPSDAPLVTQG